MNLSDLAIKRPVFITCLFFLILILGALSFSKLGIDLYPNINFPIVSVTTVYPGAGPAEMETLISKPLEDSLSSVAGVKSVRSVNKEGVSFIIVEFTLDTDVKFAEQQTKDRVSSAKPKLPEDVKESIIRTFDPSESPIITISLTAEMTPADLYDVADLEIRPALEQVSNVGVVDVVGGRKREIQVILDRKKLKEKNLSATMVAGQLKASGYNIPAGKLKSESEDAVVRTLGEFDSLDKIRNTLLTFYGNELPTKVGDIATVTEALEEEKTRTTIDGKPALTLSLFKKSGANSIEVSKLVKKKIEFLNSQLSIRYPNFKMEIVQDTSKQIKDNVDDVTQSIIDGIWLTIIVVFLFLGSLRSTLITGIALPNSLLGAFILMSAAGFTINMMTLLALSLAVGLLIDDAIVVRENIFRHIEMGKSAKEAASLGTKEVLLAVIATTMTVIAVFGPVAFLQGVVGQFFKEFGLTVCFAMMISLLDAVTMAPMLSAYFAGSIHHKSQNIFTKALDLIFVPFNKFQDFLEFLYQKLLKQTLRFPILVLIIALGIFGGSFVALKGIQKTFVPPQDNGEFVLKMSLSSGVNLNKMSDVASKVDQIILKNKEVKTTVLTAGGRNGESNEATIFVKLVPSKERGMSTASFKTHLSKQLEEYKYARIKMLEPSGFGGPQQPIMLNIIGDKMDDVIAVSKALMEKLKDNTDIKELDMSYQTGEPEFRIEMNRAKASLLGVSTSSLGSELRTQIEGIVPAVYRTNGKEYDIRVKMSEEESNIKKNFHKIFVPNLNYRPVRLADVADAKEIVGPSTIERQDRSRYIQLSAGINPKGRGLAQAMGDIKRIIDKKEITVPDGIRYRFVGQAESFEELIFNMLIAAALAILFIYLVLASLYESFITPLAIMLVLPLAACGAFYALAIMNASLDVFSMIGCIMLLGVATKNSILLVDCINQLIRDGKSINHAILEAGKIRLRPILMTSLALIAGMLPVAVGLSEASKQRTSMGIAVIGGLISSTLLTLVVIPAAYSYIEKFRRLVNRIFTKMQGS